MVLTTRFAIATVMLLDVIVRLFAESVAVMVCVPRESSAAWKVPVPLMSVDGDGSVALGSALVNVSVPA